MFNEIDVESDFKLDHNRLSSFFNDDTRFANGQINENTNNHVNYSQLVKREGEYNAFKIDENGTIHDPLSPNFHSKQRSRTSPTQLDTLEKASRSSLKPNKDMRIKLAKDLNMTERQVQIWFQNKRAKAKKFAVNPNIQNQTYGFNYTGYSNIHNNGRYAGAELLANNDHQASNISQQFSKDHHYNKSMGEQNYDNRYQPIQGNNYENQMLINQIPNNQNPVNSYGKNFFYPPEQSGRYLNRYCSANQYNSQYSNLKDLAAKGRNSNFPNQFYDQSKFVPMAAYLPGEDNTQQYYSKDDYVENEDKYYFEKKEDQYKPTNNK